MFTKAEWGKSFIFNSIRLHREWLQSMIGQQVTLSGDAEWPKVADAVIQAGYATRTRCGTTDSPILFSRETETAVIQRTGTCACTAERCRQQGEPPAGERQLCTPKAGTEAY